MGQDDTQAVVQLVIVDGDGHPRVGRPLARRQGAQEKGETPGECCSTHIASLDLELIENETTWKRHTD
jgi:hypothetical protein